MVLDCRTLHVELARPLVYLVQPTPTVCGLKILVSSKLLKAVVILSLLLFAQIHQHSCFINLGDSYCNAFDICPGFSWERVNFPPRSCCILDLV